MRPIPASSTAAMQMMMLVIIETFNKLLLSRNSKMLRVKPKNTAGYREYLPNCTAAFDKKSTICKKVSFPDPATALNVMPNAMPIRYLSQIFIIVECNRKRWAASTLSGKIRRLTFLYRYSIVHCLRLFVYGQMKFRHCCLTNII